MLRVGDLERSIAFYTQVLGMELLRRSENPEYRYTLAFLGYAGGNPGQAEIELTYNWGVDRYNLGSAFEIELTYNWGVDRYNLGSAFGHIAIGVSDVYTACDRIRAAGGNVTREPGPVGGGTTVIAFVTDPDGYKIELIQRPDDGGGTGLR